LITSLIEKAGDDHPADKKANQRNEAAHSQLKRTAQSVSARSAVRQAGPEHGDHPTQESRDAPF